MDDDLLTGRQANRALAGQPTPTTVGLVEQRARAPGLATAAPRWAGQMPLAEERHRQWPQRMDDLIARIQDRLATGWDGKPIPGISAADLERVNRPERRIPR